MKFIGLVVFLGLITERASCRSPVSRFLDVYNISKYPQETVFTSDTPPTKTIEHWLLNFYGDEDVDLPAPCNKDDLVCYWTEVELENSEKVLTKLITVTSKDFLDYYDSYDGFGAHLERLKWGPSTFSISLHFNCYPERDNDTVTQAQWRDTSIYLSIKGPSGCLLNPKKNSASGIGSWITWLIIYAVLFALIYLLATSYMNSRYGGIQDFREEFMERSGTLVSSLPQFAKEVVGKVVGGSSSSRGGYSAV